MGEEYGSDFITLTDEEGKEFELEHIDSFEFEGKEYMIFIPADEQEDSDEAEMIILQVVGEGDDAELMSLESEAELERVYDYYMTFLFEEEREED